jgi:hypothetical protein
MRKRDEGQSTAILRGKRGRALGGWDNMVKGVYFKVLATSIYFVLPIPRDRLQELQDPPESLARLLPQ